MKKRIFAIGGPTLATVLAFLAITVNAATVNFKFDYDFSADNACSPTLTTNCVQSIDIYDGVPGTGTGGTLVVSVPAPAGATALVSGITASGSVKGYGSHSINFVANARDASGNQVLSPAAVAAVVVKPGAPKNVSAQ